MNMKIKVISIMHFNNFILCESYTLYVLYYTTPYIIYNVCQAGVKIYGTITHIHFILKFGNVHMSNMTLNKAYRFIDMLSNSYQHYYYGFSALFSISTFVFRFCANSSYSYINAIIMDNHNTCTQLFTTGQC